MTWVKVLDGKAINVGTTQHREGAVVEVEDREAARWIERQLVVEADQPAKPAKKAPAKKATKRKS